ncbi:hypothetical protein DW094_06555 [Ruminococcaceae bacterium AM07-15]|nr:hypothetical protein DW094_06555 [Ruminococcaceae bacterium AM07-15]
MIKRELTAGSALFLLCQGKEGVSAASFGNCKRETTWILQKSLLHQGFWRKEKEKTPILRPFYKGGFGILQRAFKIEPVKRKKGRPAPIHGKWEE